MCSSDLTHGDISSPLAWQIYSSSVTDDIPTPPSAFGQVESLDSNSIIRYIPEHTVGFILVRKSDIKCTYIASSFHSNGNVCSLCLLYYVSL